MNVEWYRNSRHGVQRRQIIDTPIGYVLSCVELVGEGPTDLCGYQGGWQFPSRTYTTRAAAERRLRDNGWSPTLDGIGDAPTEPRARSGKAVNPTTVHTIRVPKATWAAFLAVAAARRTNCTAMIIEAIECIVRNQE